MQLSGEHLEAFNVMQCNKALLVAYAGFSKRGGGGRKFENNEDQNENFSAQNQVRFSAQN